MAKVFLPDRERLAKSGYEAVAHVPVIFDSNGRYCRELNRYLRERARLEWHPGIGGDFPRPLTLLNMANLLLNFVQWCEARGKDWGIVTYGDVLVYQSEQLKGLWSATDRKLLPSTANLRADEVTSFLRWATVRGLRGTFDVKLFPKMLRTGRGIVQTMVRVGRAKEDIISPTQAGFVLPLAEEIREWLNAVKIRRGTAKYFACKFVMNTGARRKEVEALGVDQWPSAEEITYARRRGFESVAMRLVETKGGRPRSIKVPVDHAHEVRVWIEEKRGTYAFRYSKYHRGNRTDRLFLSDHAKAHGRPISAATIYRCFAEVEPRPKGWSPHRGRHAFACFWVLYALSIEAEVHGGLSEMPASWIHNRGEHWLISLRQQFGHVSEETTHGYLRWLTTACGLAEMSSGYHHFLTDAPDD